MRKKRVPLAWRNLVHNRRRFAVSIAGIAFATILMFIEYGFLNAMYDSQVKLLVRLDGDLFLVDKLSYSVSFSIPFNHRRLYQSLSVPGVAKASPLYIEGRIFNLRGTVDSKRHNIRVLAFNPDQPVFEDPEIRRHTESLKMPDTVLLDRKSKEIFGGMAAGTVTELSGRRVRIVDTFEIGTDLVNDGNLIMSDLNYARLVPRRADAEDPLNRVDLGVLKLAPGVDPGETRAELTRILPPDVLVLEPAELIRREIRFWGENTIIGFTFWLGMLIGFVVGIVICYQILYTTVLDFLPQFGTLKAIGYADSYLVFLVFRQAVILALLGFIPGFACSLLVYGEVARLTGLPMQLNPGRFSLVLLLTGGMCLISGLLAVRKAVQADPIEVFK